METRCRPGDLAIVIFAENPSNLGLIVRVLRRDSGRSKLAIRSAGPLWTVDSVRPMLYTTKRDIFYRKRGPVPDSYMRPIRGDTAPVDEGARAVRADLLDLAAELGQP